MHQIIKNQILCELEQGRTFSEVARKFGVSLAVVVDIYWDYHHA